MFFWAIYAFVLFYMETVFHLGCYGLQGYNPVFALGLIAFIAALQALISGIQPKRRHKLIFWIMVVPEYILFAAHTVYYKIFKQPLQIGLAVAGGRDALHDYWREALTGILHALPLLLLLALPLIGMGIAQHRARRWRMPPLKGSQKLALGLGALAGVLWCVGSMVVGNLLKSGYAEDYMEFYDPNTVLREMGVLTMVQRDGWYEVENLVAKICGTGSSNLPAMGDAVTPMPGMPAGLTGENSGQSEQDPGNVGNDIVEEPKIDTSPNAWTIDMAQLAELSQDNKETKWLAQYIAELTPTKRNEYTGLFEGYNLIYLTAEGFSPYAIREDLTPTLYKMVHSSFVFTNYYVPLWQTSTSDGEYVNCTGLIPDGQRSMSKSASINMLYTLPRFFASQGVYSRAYHNNTLSFYNRHLSHPNLGYDFKASRLGTLSEKEWGGQIFPMENPNAWPASDYEMMQGTLPEYINDERFHVYYMTVSGHLDYTFMGNSMSSRNKAAVADLDMSENARAYLACQIELDKALAYLLEELEQAGKLDNTVICLSADHYPYQMSEGQYEELAGKDLSGDMDLYRNSLILWNAAMEEPVIVDKACCSVDILPTLLNLFGFRYDSRMYAGRDIFSDEEGLVIFNDRSFVSDTVVYSKERKTTTWRVDMTEEEQEAYLKAKQQDVKNRYQFSAFILRNNYYDIVGRCVTSWEPPDKEN